MALSSSTVHVTLVHQVTIQYPNQWQVPPALELYSIVPHYGLQSGVR